MAHLAAAQLNGVLYNEPGISQLDHAFIAFLSAHGSVERSLLHKYGSLLVLCQCLHDLCICGENCDLGLMGQIVISHKLSCDFRVYFIIYGSISSHIIGHFAGLSGLFPLFFHGCFETSLINSDPFFFQDLLCQIQRESIGII